MKLHTIIFILAAAHAALVPNISHLFGPSLSADANIYLITDQDYAAHVTQRWTTHSAPSYLGAIQPATIQDVQNIVKIASASDIPFLTSGGGHGVSIQMADVRNGIQLDLAKFNTVNFDAETGLLMVGGSTKFSQLVAPLMEAGAQFPLGTAPCVGVVGATLGAGVSSSQGYSGLLIDLLVEVTLVTASGEVITASRSQHTGLFWALRGAGFNFGVVTSATFKVPPTINNGNVTNANYMFTGDKALDVYGYLASLDGENKMPAELALNIGSLFIPGTEQLALVINANFLGPPGIAAQYLEPLSDLMPLRHEVLNVHWSDVFATSYFGIPDTKACGRNQHVNMRSVGARRTDPATLVKFLDHLQKFTKTNPNVQTAMMIHRFANDRVLEAAETDESSYPHRDISMHIQLECEFEDVTQDSQVDKFLDEARSLLTAVSGFQKPAVYVNFAHGDEGPAAWYGQENLEKLSVLKREWDPKNLFGFYNSISLKGDANLIDEL
ncbi:hypothetical protein BD289DRAFT_372588 [Coniella lustricola]|uniref:FAD-binding PCMH-type domain-containing protein n=1 Tax=Coniella lustricola TaxID=2025994 RepID=A0A2T3A255_9PEZI|nr:hypothetical protein BD289DRAFT_372588 [Coniella lustricola]